jgi:hypothetical protein
MADRIYGIQQGQPADVADFFRSRNRVTDLPLVEHIYEVATLKNNATKPRATDGYDLIFGDEVEQYVDNLADGRQRVYSKIHLYVVGHGTVAGFDTNVGLEKLAAAGYTEVDNLASGTDKATLLLLTGEADNGQYDDLDNWIHFTLKAGGPRYIGQPESIVDAPSGADYIRRDGEWTALDLSPYDTISSVDSKIAAAVGSTFTGRQILTTSDANVFADGEHATADPSGTSGWYYRNEPGRKINWYFYSGGEDTDTLGAFQSATVDEEGGFYMVVDARNTTSWPYLALYTARQNDGSDASWYRSRLTYGPGGSFGNKLSSGLHILVTSNFNAARLATLQGKYPTAATTTLSIESFSSAGPQGANEALWLMAISSSSGLPEGQEEFVLRESGIAFGGKVRTIQYVANPAQPPAYTTYYRGAFAGSANFPATGHLDEWLIETVEDKMYVWDVEGGTWVKTGTEAVAPTAAVNDYPYQYVYSSIDGSGYGFENAYPEGNWINTPDGKLQSTGGTSDILSRQVKFATLKTPGDEVTFQCSNNTSAFYRYGFFGLVPGTDNSALSWKVAGQPSSGVSWMVSDPADYALIEFQMSYMEPYFGGTTYGYNLADRRNSTGIGYTGNAGELPITFRVADDYRIEIFIDGHYHVRTEVVPASGVDLYFHQYGQTGRILDQPTGSGSNIQGGTAPTASGAHYYMSDAAPSRVEATILSSGGGYWLYSDTQASGVGYNIELTDAEASAARYVRAFQDFTGATLGERVAAMRPVIAMDALQLAHAEEDARGYFHSLDLTVEQIQQKMGLFADALVASRAGSVEVTLEEVNELLAAAPTSTAQTLVYDGTYAGSESAAIDPSSAFSTVLGIERFSISDTTMTLYFDGTHHTSAFAYTTTGFTVAGGGNQDGSYTFTAPVATATTLQYDLAAAGVANPSNLVNQFISGSHPLDLTFTGPGVAPVAVSGELELTQHMQGELEDHLKKFPR